MKMKVETSAVLKKPLRVILSGVVLKEDSAKDQRVDSSGSALRMTHLQGLTVTKLFFVIFVTLFIKTVFAASDAPVMNQNSALPAEAMQSSSSNETDNRDKILQDVKMERTIMSVVAGRSQLMRFSRAVNRISISDPEVIDFLILSPKEVLINAKKEGTANLIVWDLKERISLFDVNVTKDPDLLLQVLKTLDPAGNFEIYPSKDVFVIKGETTSIEKQKQIEKAANAFAEGSVSLVRVQDIKQVLLQTRFIQIDRSQNYDFGIDLEHIHNNAHNNITQRFLPGATNATTSGDSTRVTTTPSVTMAVFDRNDDDVYQIIFDRIDTEYFKGFIKALENKGVVKTIARPNLLAQDGEEASFLVGGETAIVTSTNDSINVTYKEFGTKLKFKPEVIGEHKIRLTVEPEVSSLNSAFGVTVGSTEVPGFTSAKVKSVVELEDNQTLMIGGLLQQKLNNSEQGVPFMRRLPLIGRLFESTDNEWTETELLILITPKIVRPETRPIAEEPPPHDILSKAVQMMPNRIEDGHGEAIQTYIKTGKREVVEKVTQPDNQVIVNNPVQVIDLTKPVPPTSQRVIASGAKSPFMSSPHGLRRGSPAEGEARQGRPTKPFGDDASRQIASSFRHGGTPRNDEMGNKVLHKNLDDLEKELQWEKIGKGK